MMTTVRISNKSGLHARSAATFVQLANKFQSQIKVKKDKIEVDGKSILGMMMLGAIYGSKITIRVSGPDEERALKELSELIKNKFGEE